MPKNLPQDIPQLLTLDALAKLLCISPHTLRARVRDGRLCPTRICRRLLFHPDDVERFLAQAKGEPHAASRHEAATETQAACTSNQEAHCAEATTR
jgi:hypothetical protein